MQGPAAPPREAHVCVVQLRRGGADAEPEPVPRLLLHRGERLPERGRRRRDPDPGPPPRDRRRRADRVLERQDAVARFGRRVPFIVLATPFWALFSFLLFTPPSSSARRGCRVPVHRGRALLSRVDGVGRALRAPCRRSRRQRRARPIGIRVYLGAAGAGLGLVGGFLLVDAIGYAGWRRRSPSSRSFRYVGLAGAWPYASRTQEPAEPGPRGALHDLSKPLLPAVPPRLRALPARLPAPARRAPVPHRGLARDRRDRAVGRGSHDRRARDDAPDHLAHDEALAADVEAARTAPRCWRRSRSSCSSRSRASSPGFLRRPSS